MDLPPCQGTGWPWGEVCLGGDTELLGKSCSQERSLLRRGSRFGDGKGGGWKEGVEEQGKGLWLSEPGAGLGVRGCTACGETLLGWAGDPQAGAGGLAAGMETCSGWMLGINPSWAPGPRVVQHCPNSGICHVNLETSFDGNALAVLKLIFPSRTLQL